MYKRILAIRTSSQQPRIPESFLPNPKTHQAIKRFNKSMHNGHELLFFPVKTWHAPTAATPVLTGLCVHKKMPDLYLSFNSPFLQGQSYSLKRQNPEISAHSLRTSIDRLGANRM